MPKKNIGNDLNKIIIKKFLTFEVYDRQQYMKNVGQNDMCVRNSKVSSGVWKIVETL